MWTSQELGERASKRWTVSTEKKPLPGCRGGQRCAARLAQGGKNLGKGTNCAVPRMPLGETRDVKERKDPSPPSSFQCFWQKLTGSQLVEERSSQNSSPGFTSRAVWIQSSHSALAKSRLPIFINHISLNFPLHPASIFLQCSNTLICRSLLYIVIIFA